MEEHTDIVSTLVEIFGTDELKECKRHRMSKKQIKRNKQIQKSVSEFVRRLEAAFEATKNSTLTFD